MKPTHTILGGLLAIAALVSTAEGQEKAPRPDTMSWTEGGKTIRKDGRVDASDLEKVEFTAAGKKASVPAADVIEIRWGDDPGYFETGMRALASGDGAAAKRAFEDLMGAKAANPAMRAWVDEFGNCGLGEANLLTGNADKAVEAFDRARATNARSLYLDRILKGVARAESLRKKTDAAVKALDDLAVASKAGKRADWELSALVLKSSILLQSGDHTRAAAAFDDAARFAETAAAAEKSEAGKAKLRAAGLAAAIGKGWAIVAKAELEKAQAGFDQARQYFDGLAGKYPAEPSALAAQVNAEGRAKLASGDPRAAQRIFAKAEVWHFQASEEVARSIWYQAECWKAAGDEKLRKERLSDLKEMFPGTDWARKAE